MNSGKEIHSNRSGGENRRTADGLFSRPVRVGFTAGDGETLDQVAGGAMDYAAA